MPLSAIAISYQACYQSSRCQALRIATLVCAFLVWLKETRPLGTYEITLVTLPIYKLLLPYFY